MRARPAWRFYAPPGMECRCRGSHTTRRWRGTDSNFRFPERSVKRQGRARGEITDPLSSFVSLPYGYPATACVGIKPEKPKPPA